MFRRPQPVPVPDTHQIIENGLFVVGFARSGTTILQNALNDSADIFLLGEPAFHLEADRPDFAARYNAMHRGWRNQETKSTFCPPFAAAEAPWAPVLRHIAALHRFAGAKIVINPIDGAQGVDALLAFQCRHFYRGHHVFAFRRPVDAFLSIRGMAKLQGIAPADTTLILQGYMRVVLLYLHMLRVFPFVRAIFLEAADEASFARLGEWLGVNLGASWRYYENSRSRRHELAEVAEADRGRVAHLGAFYEDFCRADLVGLDRLQLEQNTGHLDPAHLTVLGRLAWRADYLLAALADPAHAQWGRPLPEADSD